MSPKKPRLVLRTCIALFNLWVIYLLVDYAVYRYETAAQYGYLKYSNWQIAIGTYIVEVLIVGALTLAVVFANGRTRTLALAAEPIVVVFFLVVGYNSVSFGH